MLPAMTRFGPSRSSSLPPSHAPKRAGDREHDAEGADLDRVPAEGAGGIDAAEREQRHQAVGVDHVGEQERRQRFLLRQFARASACSSIKPSRSAARTGRFAG